MSAQRKSPSLNVSERSEQEVLRCVEAPELGFHFKRRDRIVRPGTSDEWWLTMPSVVTTNV